MVWFELKEVSSDLKCVLRSELHILILIRYQLHEWVFSFGSQRDEKGCKLTSSGVAIRQSFSPISVGCTSITDVPNRLSFCGLIVSSSPTRIHRLHNEILGHNGAANVPPPHFVPFSSPFLPSFWDEEWNAPQRVAFFSSRGNWESRQGPLWCYFPFRVGRRCLVAQLKMIIWEPVKQGSPLEAQRYAKKPRSRLMSWG